jgi:hypothetical protein
MRLRPFFSYYGSKWRLAPRYPVPVWDAVVEPFAGSACYSLLHHRRDVMLIDRYDVVCAVWEYLINVGEKEILGLPLLAPGEPIPSSLCDEAQLLIGFWVSKAVVSPGRTMNSQPPGVKSLERMGYWSASIRSRIASQLRFIRHWRIRRGSYDAAPDIEATWFVDPPYSSAAGRRYVHSDVAYRDLAAWCMARRGQLVVCEGVGADWLPFQAVNGTKGMRRDSMEAVYTHSSPNVMPGWEQVPLWGAA